MLKFKCIFLLSYQSANFQKQNEKHKRHRKNLRHINTISTVRYFRAQRAPLSAAASSSMPACSVPSKVAHIFTLCLHVGANKAFPFSRV